MKVELNLTDADFEIIKMAKQQGTKVENLTLSVIGDIVLSNIIINE